MQRLPTQFVLQDTSSGIISKVKWNLTPPNSVELGVNMVFDENYGEAMVRKGSTIIGAQVTPFSNAIAGLHYFSNSAGTVARLIATANNGSNNISYYYNGSSWSATTGLTTDTAGVKTRFETFLDYAVRVNGTDAVRSSSDGITWASNAPLDDSHLPTGAKFAKVYQAQLTVAGATSRPDSLYVSSVPNSTGTAISWTSGNREIVISPQDGENITGLGVVSGVEVIFKDFSQYRWNNRTTEAQPLVDVGCTSHESITNFGAGWLGFFNRKGIWMTQGQYPLLISRRIQKWIDGMSSSYVTNVAGAGDEDYLYESLGDCTVDGRTFSNVVARYSFTTKEWAIYSYANQFRVFSPFVSSGVKQIVGGDSTNRVLQIESSSLTDNSTNIGFELQTQDLDFGSRGFIKELSDRIMVYGLNPANVLIQVKVDTQDWVTLGGMTKPTQQFLINQQLKGHLMKFRVIGVSSTARFRFQGIELPGVTLLDYAE